MNKVEDETQFFRDKPKLKVAGHSTALHWKKIVWLT